MKRLLLIAAFLAIIGGVVIQNAFAAPASRTIETNYDEDIAVFGEPFTLMRTGVVNGDVAVAGGSAEIDGQLYGDLAVAGGNVVVSGVIDGDVAVMGGSLTIDEGGMIHGDCSVMGGSVKRYGRHHENECHSAAPDFGWASDQWVDGPSHRGLRPSSTIFTALVSAVIWGLIGLIAAAAFPVQLHRVAGAIEAKPVQSGAFGLFTFIASMIIGSIVTGVSALLIIVCIGLLGLPIGIAILISPLVAILFGGAAQGKLLGERIALRYKKSWGLGMTTAIGSAAIALGLGLLAAFPFGTALSTIAELIICSISIGAVALTRFGTRPYPHLTAEVDEIKVQDAINNMPS